MDPKPPCPVADRSTPPGHRGPLAHLAHTEVVRFLVVGVINTLVGYLLYLAALTVLPYRVAYTAAYALAILSSYALNTYFVFRARWDWRRLLAFPLVYLTQYAASLACLSLLVERLSISEKIAPLVVVLVIIPITYFASRYVLKRKLP